MATKKKAAKKKSSAKKRRAIALVATASPRSFTADVTFRFASGIGQATASLFRNGLQINMQSISSSGTIHFAEVQSGDVVSVNGVCTGTADIAVSVPTDPVTPEQFTAGIIIAGYLIN